MKGFEIILAGQRPGVLHSWLNRGFFYDFFYFPMFFLFAFFIRINALEFNALNECFFYSFFFVFFLLNVRFDARVFEKVIFPRPREVILYWRKPCAQGVFVKFNSVKTRTPEAKVQAQ